MIDIDASLVEAHSEQEGAKPTFKRGFGFFQILVFADHGEGGTGECLAGLLRPGKANANNAADHITVVTQALEQIPEELRSRVLVRGVTAEPGRTPSSSTCTPSTFSTPSGWVAGPTILEALDKLPRQAWKAALDPDGFPRDGAQVAELTRRRWPSRGCSSGSPADAGTRCWSGKGTVWFAGCAPAGQGGRRTEQQFGPRLPPRVAGIRRVGRPGRGCLTSRSVRRSVSGPASTSHQGRWTRPPAAAATPVGMEGAGGGLGCADHVQPRVDVPGLSGVAADPREQEHEQGREPNQFAERDHRRAADLLRALATVPTTGRPGRRSRRR